MVSTLRLYSLKQSAISNFLNNFYSSNVCQSSTSYWEKNFLNPLEACDIIAALIDNQNTYPSISAWISIDPGVFIKIQSDNYNHFIKYMFERYPY